jgi:hypothetical protein
VHANKQKKASGTLAWQTRFAPLKCANALERVFSSCVSFSTFRRHRIQSFQSKPRKVLQSISRHIKAASCNNSIPSILLGINFPLINGGRAIYLFYLWEFISGCRIIWLHLAIANGLFEHFRCSNGLPEHLSLLTDCPGTFRHSGIGFFKGQISQVFHFRLVSLFIDPQSDRWLHANLLLRTKKIWLPEIRKQKVKFSFLRRLRIKSQFASKAIRLIRQTMA